MQRADGAEHGELGEDVAGDDEVDHPLAAVDGLLADDLACGVRAAEPDGGGDEEEEGGGAARQLVKVGGAAAREDEGEDRSDDGGLHGEDGGVGPVLPLDAGGPLAEDAPLSPEAAAVGLLFAAGAELDGALSDAALDDELLMVGGGFVGGSAAVDEGAHTLLALFGGGGGERISLLMGERAEGGGGVVEQLLELRRVGYFGVEVGDGVGVGGAVVGHAALDEIDDAVHQPVGLERGLVDGEQDGLALIGKTAEQPHDIDGVFGGEAAGGLVEEEEGGLGDELLGQVDPLALAAGDALSDRVSDLHIAGLLDLQLGEDALNLGVDLFVAGVGRQAEASGVVERLVDGELREDDVVLRDISDVSAEGVVVLVEVGSVEEALAFAGDCVAVEGHHQRGLAGARGAHQADEFGGEDGEGDVVEDALATAGRLGVWHIDRDTFGLQDDVAEILLAEHAGGRVEAELEASDGEAIGGRDAYGTDDAGAVEEGAVGAAEVGDLEGVADAADLEVAAGDLGLVEDEVDGARLASNREGRSGRQRQLVGPSSAAREQLDDAGERQTVAAKIEDIAGRCGGLGDAARAVVEEGAVGAT